MLLALITALGIASLSLLGALFGDGKLKPERLHRVILPGAVGIFLGVVFFELIPETLTASEAWGPLSILGGFLGFYALSHVLDTYHHHHTDAHDGCAHGGVRKLLIGDGVHNFADGIVIATSYMINPVAGILSAAGIALHEIPQEIAEYAVLRSAGYAKKRALFLNFCSALAVVAGTLITYLLGDFLHEYLFIFTGVAAGNLLYIATADLIPELRHSHREHFKTMFASTLVGVALIGTLITVSHHALEQDAHTSGNEEGNHTE